MLSILQDNAWVTFQTGVLNNLAPQTTAAQAQACAARQPGKWRPTECDRCSCGSSSGNC